MNSSNVNSDIWDEAEETQLKAPLDKEENVKKARQRPTIDLKKSKLFQIAMLGITAGEPRKTRSRAITPNDSDNTGACLPFKNNEQKSVRNCNDEKIERKSIDEEHFQTNGNVLNKGFQSKDTKQKSSPPPCTSKISHESQLVIQKSNGSNFQKNSVKNVERFRKSEFSIDEKSVKKPNVSITVGSKGTSRAINNNTKSSFEKTNVSLINSNSTWDDVSKIDSSKNTVINSSLKNDECIQLYEDNSLTSSAQFNSCNNSQNCNKTEVQEEEFGWPNLLLEKEKGSNCDDSNIWDISETESKGKIPSYRRSVSMHDPSPCNKHNGSNISKSSMFLNSDAKFECKSNQKLNNSQISKETESGWPKLASEKGSICVEDNNWNSCETKGKNKLSSCHRSALMNDPMPDNKHNGPNISKSSVLLNSAVKFEYKSNQKMNNSLMSKETESGWPKLASEKESICIDNNNWDFCETKGKNKLSSYHRSASMNNPSPSVKHIGPNVSKSSALLNSGAKFECKINPKLNNSQMNKETESGWPKLVSEKEKGRSCEDVSVWDTCQAEDNKNPSYQCISGGKANLKGQLNVKKEFSQPNLKLNRSKSFKDTSNYHNKYKNTESMSRYEDFSNIQDSVSAGFHSGGYLDFNSFNQNNRSNKENAIFVKNLKQTRPDSCNALKNSDNLKKALESKDLTTKPNSDTHYANFSSKVPEAITLPTNHKEIENKKTDVSFSKSSVASNSDDWSDISDTLDASADELDVNCKREHLVFATNTIDPKTGLENLRITCNVRNGEDRSKLVISESKNQSDFENANKLAEQSYSDPLEAFFRTCSEHIIPAPQPVKPDCISNPALQVQKQRDENTSDSAVDMVLTGSLTAETLLERNASLFSTVTSYIEEIVAEKSMRSSIYTSIVEDVRRVLSYNAKEYFVYGSFDNGLAISTSNLNLALKSSTLHSSSFLQEVQKLLSKGLKNYHVHPFEDEKDPSKCKVCFTDYKTGIMCEIVCCQKNFQSLRKMGKLIKQACHYDARIKTLLIATKIWAEVCLINEPENGKLHTIGYTILMLHFLQKLEKPLLPVIDGSSENVVLKPLEIKNNASVGELWLEFLKFYGYTFKWEDYIATLDSEKAVLKSSKSWAISSYFAIEDPFTHKNIGESVISHDCADLIFSCFKASYEYFASPSDEPNDSSINKKYSFNDIAFDQSLPFCDACDELGETCGKCRPAKEIILQRLSKLSDCSSNCVETALQDVYNEFILPDYKIEGRKAYVRDLEASIRQIYPGAKLTLFGSSVNAFGFNRSDLDICMTLGKESSVAGNTMTNTEITMTIKNIVRHLRRKKHLYKNVIGLYHSQVPIVKFKFINEDWHCDLSLNNILAVHNSTLLCKYALLDKRCRILGCALKLLAKKACLNGSSLHSLSSYSYILMTIHYLQQVQPPVLPVLPLDDKKVFEKELVVPGEFLKERNFWFSENVDQLRRRYMTSSPKNQSSISELWLDLLNFYVSYDGTKAITITQKEPMPSTMLQKCASLFNIEDPFIVGRNLGCILDDSRAEVTRKVLGRARLLFGKEIDPDWKRCPKNYYFSSSNLSGQFVKEVECLGCGGFGHERSDCDKEDPFKYCKFKAKTYNRRPSYQRKV